MLRNGTTSWIPCTFDVYTEPAQNYRGNIQEERAEGRVESIKKIYTNNFKGEGFVYKITLKNLQLF